MKKAKKILTLVACAVLLVCISVGATIAYLTSTTETVTNTFTVGAVSFDDDPDTELDEGLDEERVDIYGKDANVAQERVDKNTYKLLPSHTYIKDPTLHIDTDSEACYARAIVTVTDYADLYAIVTAGMDDEQKAALTIENIAWLISQNVGGFNTDVWSFKKVEKVEDTLVYEFRVTNIVVPQDGLYVNGELVTKTTEAPGIYGAKDDAYDIVLFETINVPEGLTNEQLATLATEYELDANGNPTETVKEEAMQIKIEAHLIQADGFENADQAWEAFTK